MPRTRLLLIHPDPHALVMLASMLRPSGHELVEAASDRQAPRLLRCQPGLVLQAVDPAEPEALELLAYIRRKYPHVPVVLLFTRPQPERAGEALGMGASAVLRFPPPATQLRAVVAHALAPCEASDDPPVLVERQEGEGVTKPGGDTCHANPVARRIDEAVIARLRPLREALEGPEREIILEALRAYGGCRQAAAKALAIDRTTLFKKMKKYGLLGDRDE